MNLPPAKPSPHTWGDTTVAPGCRADVQLVVGESSSGYTLRIPISVRRGRAAGPSLLVTAALHGDELNGTGAVRDLILDEQLKLLRGTLVLVPVLNVLGFESHSRYLPDRRDLNRCFPGSSMGSLASRLARSIYMQLVQRADFIIDLHTAAVRRTNFPNVRADTMDGATRRLANSFGSRVIIQSRGPQGSLRRVATEAGVPTITFEGGEVWKVEPQILAEILRGVHNVMVDLQMIDGQPVPHASQSIVTETKWLRADQGGFVQFHAALGDIVQPGQLIATRSSLLGQDKTTFTAPFESIVIGMTTLPVVGPGEAICHLAILSDPPAPP